MLVSKISYGQIVKGLKKLSDDNDLDRSESPHLTPIGYKSSISSMIESVLRANHERCPRDLPEKVMDYLYQKGLIVKYAGNDYQFPSTGKLPTKEEIITQTRSYLDKLESKGI